jgi:hypothetical protein
MTNGKVASLSSAQIDAFLTQELLAQLKGIRKSSLVAERFAANPQSLSARVLLRHSAEHVIRIRRFRQLDSDASKMIERDFPGVAEKWSRYARSEAVHDRYYLRDLEAMGITRDAVDGLEPLPSTLQLLTYVREAMVHYGPLPVVLYSYWTEKNSDLGSNPVIDCLGARFGKEKVRGASAHRALDDNLDHAVAVTEILSALLDTDRLFVAKEILSAISQFIGEYFRELEELDQSLSAEAPTMKKQASYCG